MLVFESALDEATIKTRMQILTSPASIIGTEWSKQYTLWQRGSYFELTYPTFSGQTSFCGRIQTTNNTTQICGRFMLNHYILLGHLLIDFLAPIIIFVMWQSFVQSLLTFVALLTGSIIVFFISPQIGTYGNNKVQKFIVENLLQ